MKTLWEPEAFLIKEDCPHFKVEDNKCLQCERIIKDKGGKHENRKNLQRKRHKIISSNNSR